MSAKEEKGAQAKAYLIAPAREGKNFAALPGPGWRRWRLACRYLATWFFSCRDRGGIGGGGGVGVDDEANDSFPQPAPLSFVVVTARTRAYA